MRRDARLLLLPVALLLLALVGLSAATRGFILVDTYDLLYGTAAASRCIGDGVLSGCHGVNQFALLQYLPALGFHELGLSLNSAANGLVTLNGLAVLGILVVVTVLVTRSAGAAAGALAAAILLASPLLWYAHAAFGEPLAAAAITGFVTALLVGAAPWVTGLALFLGGISKETAVPVIFALAGVVWLMRQRSFRRGELIAMATGATAAVLVNSAFNVFRYGGLSNQYYTESALQARPAEVPVNLASLVASPTQGLIWMWPAIVVVVCAVAAVALRRRRLREPGLAIAAIFCLLLLLLAQWFAPQGGTTWGPRLMMPWLPALLLLSLVAYPATTRAAVARLVGRSRATAAVVAAALLLAGLPHIIVTVDSARHPHAPPGLNASFSEVAVRPFVPDATCPEQPSVIEDRDYDRNCLEHRTWHRGIAAVAAYRALPHSLILAFSVLWAMAVVGLIAYARVRALRQVPTLA